MLRFETGQLSRVAAYWNDGERNGWTDQEPASGRFILEQFTGLLDSNGKEIYEGDICKTQKGNRVVRYFAPNFSLYKGMEDDLETTVDCDSFSTPIAFEEVVGNIHENRELLGQ